MSATGRARRPLDCRRHIREHMVDPAATQDDPRRLAAEELVGIVHAYLT